MANAESHCTLRRDGPKSFNEPQSPIQMAIQSTIIDLKGSHKLMANSRITRYIVPYSFDMHRPIPGAQIGCTCSELCRRGESLSNLGEKDRKGQQEDMQSATDDHLMSCEADRITTD